MATIALSLELTKHQEELVNAHPEAMALLIMRQALWDKGVSNPDLNDSQRQWCLDHYNETNLKLKRVTNAAW